MDERRIAARRRGRGAAHRRRCGRYHQRRRRRRPRASQTRRSARPRHRRSARCHRRRRNPRSSREMKRSPKRSPRSARGVALLAVLSVLLIIGAYFALASLSLSSVQVTRERSTGESLQRAKEALIAYAVSDTTRPGELPCPDVNDDGKLALNQDYVGSACVSLIGRLPWITLGLPDLRDDTGERLWYALSNDFHANGTVPLNSDTAYRAGNSSLNITGTQPGTNLVAIVFSPGPALVREGAAAAQQRGCIVGTNCDAAGKCTTAPASNTPKCNPANYLDVTGGQDNADADKIFIAAAKSDTFNDRLLPIYSDDIMWLVERRAGR